jgi:hypothetical protein
MAPASTPSSTDSTLKAYEDKINAQIRDAMAKLDQFEARTATQRTQAPSKAIEQLKVTRQSLEQKVRALKTTQEANIDRAKANIDAEIAKAPHVNRHADDPVQCGHEEVKKLMSTAFGDLSLLQPRDASVCEEHRTPRLEPRRKG